MSSVVKTLLKVGGVAVEGVPLAKESMVLKAAKAKLGLGLTAPDVASNVAPKVKRTKAQVAADAVANKARKASEKEAARVLREQVAAETKAAKLLESEGLAATKYLDKTYNQAIREHSRAVVNFNNLHNKALGQGYLTDKQLDVLKKHYASIEEYGATLNNLQRGGYEGTFPRKFELPKNSFNQTAYKPPKPIPNNPADFPLSVLPEPKVKPKTPEETIELNIKDAIPEEPVKAAKSKASSKGAKTKTPDPLGDIGYGTKDNPGYRPDEDIDINATDNPKYKPTPEDLAARKKQRELEEEIHRMASGANYEKEFVEHMQMNDDVYQRTLSKYAAFVDQLATIVGKDNASRILANSAEGTNSSAAHYLKNFVLETESKMQGMLQIFNKALDVSAWSVLSKDKYAANLAKVKELKQGLTERLLINAQEFREGKVISMSNDMDIQNLVDAYVKSNLAVDTSKKLADTGIIQVVDNNPFSIPTKHSYEAVQSRIQAGRIVKEDYYDMIGDQLTSLNPSFASRKFKAREVGEAFYNKLEDKIRNGSTKDYTPVSSGDTVLDTKLDDLFVGSSDFSGKIKLDFNKIYTSPTTGETYKLSEFIDADIFENIRTYNNRAGGLYGLSKSGLLVEVPENLLNATQKAANLAAEKAGKAPPLHLKTITSEADFERWAKSFIDDMPAGAASKEAQKVLENTLHLIMGRAAGEEVSAGFKAFNTLSGMIFLKSSGVLNALDTMTSGFFLGGLSMLGTLVASLPTGKFWKFVGKDMTQAEAEESIAFIQASRRAVDGNSRSFAHTMNNEAFAGNKLYEAVGHMGTKTTWYNLSEHVRRMQLFTVARIIDSEMAKLAKGVGQTGRKSLSEYFRNSGVTQDMIDKWGEAIRKFGHDTRKWSAEYHPERLEVEIGSLMDRAILGTYAGELPGFLSNSSVGKALLPFLSATFALQNKLTRYTMKRGNLAIAELIAYQAPAALAVTYLREVAAGRNPEDLTAKQLIFGFLSSLSALGSYTLFLNLINQDGGRGLSFGSAVGGFPNQIAKVLLKGTKGEADMRDVLSVMPLLAVSPILNTLTGKVFFPD